MGRFKNRGDMRELGGPGNSTSERILYKLETVYLGLGKIKVERVAVIKFRVNTGGGDITGSFQVEIRTIATKLTCMRIPRFGQYRDLVRKSKVFIEDRAKIASTMGSGK